MACVIIPPTFGKERKKKEKEEKGKKRKERGREEKKSKRKEREQQEPGSKWVLPWIVGLIL